MSNKEIFIETYNKNIHRPGAESRFAWLEGTIPASTRFPPYEGGLLDLTNVQRVCFDLQKHFNPRPTIWKATPSFLSCTICARPVSTRIELLRNRKTLPR